MCCGREMLASAFGALSSRSPNYKFRAMQWWPFPETDEDAPWISADLHSSIEDIWSSRPRLLIEDEQKRKRRLLTSPIIFTIKE